MMTKPAAKRPKAPPGSYTRKAHEVRAKAAKQTSDVVTAALEWCLKEKKGSKAAEHSGLFPGVTYNMIEPRLKKLKKKKTTPEVGLRSHHAQLLTDTERVKVGKWIAGCADGHCPKDPVPRSRRRSSRSSRHGISQTSSASTASGPSRSTRPNSTQSPLAASSPTDSSSDSTVVPCAWH